MKCWRAREQFKVRVLEWAAKLDVKAHSIYIRPMRRKWASCSTAGTLSFNDELIGMETKLGDYVIVHELAHLVEANHSPAFNALVAEYPLAERARGFLMAISFGETGIAQDVDGEAPQPEEETDSPLTLF